MRLALVLTVVCLAARGAEAQTAPVPAIDSARLAQDLNAFVPRIMREANVPGLVIGIVQNGRIAHLAGYGVADVETKRPVHPERTVFRLGSLTKPITALAVMQLVEQGKIDLKADVNRYMRDVQLPAAFGKAITAHDLLTHTSGLDVRLNATAARSEEEVMPLGAYLARDLPARVRAPGEMLSYSNHGYSLLGHLVEAVSGESYSFYVIDKVFRPLGMNNSSVRFTAEVKEKSAVGYEESGGRLVEAPPIHPQIVPAASLNATGGDMTRFMLAMLDSGRLADGRVLSPGSVALMQAAHFRQDERMPGMTYGFMESVWHGQRMLLHSGGIHGYMSAMYLWPEHGIGLFVANNGYRGDVILDILFHFMDTALPFKDSLPPRIADANPSRYGGAYRTAYQSQRTLEKAGVLRNPALIVRPAVDGTLHALGASFIPVAPGLFRAASGEMLAFMENPDHSVRGVITNYPFQGTEVHLRESGSSSSRLLRAISILALLVSVLTLIWPPRLTAGSRISAWIPRVARVVSLSVLLVAVLLVIGARAGGLAGQLYGVPWPMDAASLVAIIAAAGSVALIVMLVATFAETWKLRNRIHAWSFAGISAALTWVLFSLNLIGIHH